MATVADLLLAAQARLRETGAETPRLDAELLLGHVIGLERTALIAHPAAPVGDGAERQFEAIIERRAAGEPVAYIRGLREFYGLAFSVDRRALIPRPETERLVELAEAEIAARLTAGPRPAGTLPLEVVDIGTGSGAIIVALAVALRRRGMLGDVRLLATDVSPEATALARENAVAHAVADRIDVATADLVPAGVGPFEVIVANLPYVRGDAIAGLPRATSFEPRLALDGGSDGLAVIRRLLAALPSDLAPDGVALLEIGADHGTAIGAAVAEGLPGWSCRVEPDLAGLPRVARIERAGVAA